MQSLFLIIHVALAVGVIGLVLIQHGKGADAGAAFGSGASATVFGARGAATFMTRMTTLLASLFFLTSLTLFYLAANRDRGTGSVTDGVTDLPGQSAPAASEPAEAPAGDLPAEIDAAPVAEDEAPAAGDDADLPADDTSTTDDELPPPE